jgi:hypothetical protein
MAVLTVLQYTTDALFVSLAGSASPAGGGSGRRPPGG